MNAVLGEEILAVVNSIQNRELGRREIATKSLSIARRLLFYSYLYINIFIWTFFFTFSISASSIAEFHNNHFE